VQDADVQAGQAQALATGKVDDLTRLLPRRGRAELLLQHRQQLGRERAQRVLEPVVVVGMDVCRDAAGRAHGRHRADVVDVAVGEQHRGRAQPVLAQHLGEPVLDPDAGVHDEALLARGGREDVAVGGESRCGESDGQHAAEPNRHGVVTTHRRPCGDRCLD
jgi:hypothetical protein